MTKAHDFKRSAKKLPQRTLKEKRQAKRDKKYAAAHSQALIIPPAITP